MPNLFSDLPVAILAWVLASISGLTRSEIATLRPLRGRDGGEQFELRLGLHVHAQDIGVDRGGKLGLRLADAGEHDLVGRNAGGERARELAARHHVGAGAEPRQRADHRLVGIRLHGVADQRPHVREGAGEHLVVPRQGARRNSSRTACRPRPPAGRGRRPRRGARRRDTQNGAWSRDVGERIGVGNAYSTLGRLPHIAAV